MTERLRYVLVAAFVACFAFIPEADPQQLAFLQTRAWLMDEQGPLQQAVVDGQLPPLQVQMARLNQEERQEQYQRIAREWLRSNKDVEANPDLQPISLHVRVGDQGFQAQCHIPSLPENEQLLTLKLVQDRSQSDKYLPDRWSLVPAFLAIALAILTGKIIPALFMGCLAGAWLSQGSLLSGFRHLSLTTIGKQVLWDDFSLQIIGFVIFLFMTVGIMTRAGGVQGMVSWVRRYAKGPISSQLCSYVVGLLIFFDDYSNCILTGTTMRPLTDRNRVSREKLSYIVDSTAAPIAGISIFSTWVAYEISMFQHQLPEVTKADGSAYQESEGFSVFLQTLPFRFYCLFTLIMVLLTIVLRREFGPMLKAERRARSEGKPIADGAKPMVSDGFAKLEAPADIPHRARNAAVPILALVSLTLALIIYLGWQNIKADGGQLDGDLWANIRSILNATDSTKALLLASGTALLLATVLAVGQRLLSLKECMHAALRSAHSLGFAVFILILAWAIGKTCGDLGTNQFLTAAFHGSFDAWLLPALMFGISALVSFSTGTSYGTMAILLPNVVVLAHSMGMDSDLGGPALMVLTIGAVLEGSIFGDHCSPISDTTVLSSVATGCDHLHHVQTQAPYAVFIMLVSILCGYLPMALLGPQYWPLAWAAGILAILSFLFLVGRRSE